jgi:hypothetical protein
VLLAGLALESNRHLWRCWVFLFLGLPESFDERDITDLVHFSIKLFEPVGALKRFTVHVQKESISELSVFFDSIRNVGEIVRRENFV